MRNTLLFSLLMVGLLAMPSYATVVVPTQLDFLSCIDTSGNNSFDPGYFPSTRNVIWAEANIESFGTAYDKVNVGEIDGDPSYFIIDFQYDFIPQSGSGYMANLKKLDMIRNWPLIPENRDGGRFILGSKNDSSDSQSIFLDFGTLEVESDYLEGTFNTDGGGALPVNEIDQELVTKSFYTEHDGDIRQKAVIYDGDLDVNYGILGTVYTQSFDDDIMAHRAVGSAEEGLGYITTTFVEQNGYEYTYSVHLEMPLEVTIEETVSVPILGDKDVTVTAMANVVAEGTFTQTIIPGDANWDGFVDGSDATILANYWQYGIGMTTPDATWEMGDFNGDHVVDGSDATLLASYWQEGTPPTAAVPEPGTIALVLSALAGLALIRRRR